MISVSGLGAATGTGRNQVFAQLLISTTMMLAASLAEARMISDIHDWEKGTTIPADICVIGSGAAGIAIAREFLGTPHSVILLEAGGRRFEGPSQDPYRSHVVGLRHGGIHTGRARVVGGSTTLWAGQALPLFDVDFEKREWVPYSGWPISRESLTPFYHRAEDVMQIPHAPYDASIWPARRPPAPTFTEGTLVTYLSQFTPVPNFADKYGAAIAAAPNVRLITHANVVSMEADEKACTLRKVALRSIEGHTIAVKARYFIVCAGGIESARMLLLSDSVEPTGIGNRFDVVGRYFQDHPGIAVPITTTPGSSLAHTYDSFRLNGFRHSVKIAASSALQRKEGITHIGSEVYYPEQDNDSVTAAKNLLRIAKNPQRYRELPANLLPLLRQPHRVLAAAYRYYIKRVPASVGSGNPTLGMGGEQEPNPQSRVTLSQEQDALGKRRVSLDWRLTKNDSRSIEVFARTVAAEWRRLDLATVHLDQVEIIGRELGEHGGYIDANHHMGTTRMGDDPRTSVVDAHCRVHGYDNLYIGSSSVFPTGGFSNPTLTILALCLRIADEIKLQLA